MNNARRYGIALTAALGLLPMVRDTTIVNIALCLLLDRCGANRWPWLTLGLAG